MALISAKSIEDFITVQLVKWQELEPTININKDSMVYMDAAVMAELAYMLQLDAVTLANNAFLAYATGDELSNLGADRGMYRKVATRSSGVARFGRATKAAANYVIPAGTRISTQPGGDGTSILFATTTEATLYGTVPQVINVSGQQNTAGVMISNSHYHYKVTAVDGNGVETNPSDVFSILTTTGSNNKSVNLTWAAAARATKYRVYVASGVGQENNVQFLAESIPPFYTDTLGEATTTETPPETNDTGSLTVDVAAESLLPASKTNVGAATVTQLIDKPTGIEYVTNPSGFSGGSDEEDDDTYRARIRNNLATNTGLTTIAGMKRIATGVAGVSSATVYLPYPSGQRNEIWIYVTPQGGGIASDALVASVQVEFDKEENRAPVDNITVKKPDAVAIDVEAVVLEFDSLVTSEDSIIDDIKTGITNYLSTVDVGGKIRAVDINNVIHDTSGVKDFQLIIPSGNIQLGVTEAPIVGTLDITY